jgi:hypothetical protein
VKNISLFNRVGFRKRTFKISNLLISSVGYDSFLKKRFAGIEFAHFLDGVCNRSVSFHLASHWIWTTRLFGTLEEVENEERRLQHGSL